MGIERDCKGINQFLGLEEDNAVGGIIGVSKHSALMTGKMVGCGKAGAVAGALLGPAGAGIGALLGVGVGVALAAYDSATGDD